MKCLISDCMAVCRLELPVCRRSQNRATGCQSGGLPTDRAAAHGVWGISPKTFTHTQPGERSALGASIQDSQLVVEPCRSPRDDVPGNVNGTVRAFRTCCASGNRPSRLVASPVQADDGHRSGYARVCQAFAVAPRRLHTSTPKGTFTRETGRFSLPSKGTSPPRALRTAHTDLDAHEPHPAGERRSTGRPAALLPFPGASLVSGRFDASGSPHAEHACQLSAWGAGRFPPHYRGFPMVIEYLEQDEHGQSWAVCRLMLPSGEPCPSRWIKVIACAFESPKRALWVARHCLTETYPELRAS